MRPNIMASQSSSRKSFCKLFDRSICPEDLLLLSKADALGRAIEQDYAPTESFLQKRLTEFREILSRPFVQGADLVAAGFQPGNDFREALAYAHKMRLAGGFQGRYSETDRCMADERKTKKVDLLTKYTEYIYEKSVSNQSNPILPPRNFYRCSHHVLHRSTGLA